MQPNRSDSAAIHPTFGDGKILRWLQVIAEMRLAYEAEAKVHELISYRRAQLIDQIREGR